MQTYLRVVYYCCIITPAQQARRHHHRQRTLLLCSCCELPLSVRPAEYTRAPRTNGPGQCEQHILALPNTQTTQIIFFNHAMLVEHFLCHDLDRHLCCSSNRPVGIVVSIFQPSELQNQGLYTDCRCMRLSIYFAD